MNSVVRHLKEDKAEVENRFKARLKKMEPTKPKPFNLSTMNRAAERDTEGRARRDAALAPPDYPKFAAKHTSAWSIRGTRKRYNPYEPSIMEPKWNTDSPERLKLRQRPWSALTLAPVGKKENEKTLAVPANKSFRSSRDMDYTISRLYEPGYSTRGNSCDYCQSGVLCHHWNEKRKKKLSRRLPLRVLRSLYGNKAHLLKLPGEPDRPFSAQK